MQSEPLHSGYILYCMRSCCKGTKILHNLQLPMLQLPLSMLRCRLHACALLHFRYLPHAFLVNNVQVEGPILCLPESWLLWDVRTFSDITPSSLAILGLIDPPPEVLVVGCGATMRPLPQELQQFLRQRNIATEVLDTVSQAARV